MKVFLKKAIKENTQKSITTFPKVCTYKDWDSESSPCIQSPGASGLQQKKDEGFPSFLMTPSTITNKHSSSTKALHVAQSTSFSSRTTLPIKTRKKKTNLPFLLPMLTIALFSSLGTVWFSLAWHSAFLIKDYICNIKYCLHFHLEI